MHSGTTRPWCFALCSVCSTQFPLHSFPLSQWQAYFILQHLAERITYWLVSEMKMVSQLSKIIKAVLDPLQYTASCFGPCLLMSGYWCILVMYLAITPAGWCLLDQWCASSPRQQVHVSARQKLRTCTAWLKKMWTEPIWYISEEFRIGQ